jgi:hypothetical protein
MDSEVFVEAVQLRLNYIHPQNHVKVKGRESSQNKILSQTETTT